MNPADRRKLNQKTKAMQHRLRIGDDDFKQIVLGIEPRSEGHLTHCDDETANLVLISLRRLAERISPSQGEMSRPAGQTGSTSHQARMIARLMDYLNWRWSNTASLCKRMTGKPRTDKCTPHELSLVIRAMVSIIDGDIASGKLKLSGQTLQDYLSHTKKFRKTISSPYQGEGQGGIPPGCHGPCYDGQNPSPQTQEVPKC